MGLRLYLVRHAAPAEWAVARCLPSEVPLSRDGLEQSQQLATAFNGQPLAAVYASAMQRAIATAEPIAAAAGRTMICRDSLNEIDFGAFDGLTFDEIARRDADLYQQWMTTPAKVRFPAGECFRDMKARVLSVVTAIRRCHGGAVVVVSHGGPIRAILGAALAIPDHAVFRVTLDHAGVSLVDWIGEQAVVRGVNLPSMAVSL
jgi:broad specificity phosphatase PhoE